MTRSLIHTSISGEQRLPGKIGGNVAPRQQLDVESEVSSCARTVKNSDMLSQGVNERYRCPEDFFEFSFSKQLPSENGFFRFGANRVCYGRSFKGTLQSQPESLLYDAMKDVAVDTGKVTLPFDPSDVIDNLRLERYARSWDRQGSVQRFFRHLYYWLRPFMNLAMRRRVQKFHSRDWKKRAFPRWPVDTTVEDICETLLLISMEAKGVKRIPFVWFWPDGAQSCLLMTHDVETEVGRDRCADLMDVDDSFGIKAVFGIVPEVRYAVTQTLLNLIRTRGFEVAIQDLNHDGGMFESKEEFLRRAQIVNNYGREYCAKGFRAAILYRNPEWYNALEFAYDMSIPNVAHLDPQHGGCCTVMPYFIGDILELPVTTTQDYTLFHVLDQRCIDLWKSQTDLILQKNGLMSFIIHPDYLIESSELSVYKALLGHLQQMRKKALIWNALPTEIDWWWRARSKMTVVPDGHSWRIEGDETGRAVLAYANNIDGHLFYEVSQPAATR